MGPTLFFLLIDLMIDRGYCRYYILYSLRLRLPFPNDIEILRPKVGLGPNQM